MRIEIRGAEKLTFAEKRVVVLKEMGKTVEEMARQLKTNPGNVLALLNRANSKGYKAVIIIPGEILGLAEEEDGDGQG